jgi:hypothetical protein
MAKKKNEGALCIYCCERPSTAGKGDHVIASGFFPPEMRASPDYQPITVPACRECQDRFHKDEEYVISLFPLDIQAGNPAALSVATGPLQRSISKSPGVWRQVRRSAKPVNVILPSGLSMGSSLAISPDMKRYETVFWKIVHGLYFYHMRGRLPMDHGFGVFETDSAHADEYYKQMLAAGMNGIFELGPGVFRWAFLAYRDNPLATDWLMVFYPGDRAPHGKFFHLKTTEVRVPGDILNLPAPMASLQPGDYILLERDEREATVCTAARLLTGEIVPSPLTTGMHLSVLTVFRKVGHIDLESGGGLD